MGQLLLDFFKFIINSILNLVTVPFFELIKVIPGMDDLLTRINNLFNEFVWDFFRFIPAFFIKALHFPREIFVIIANTITIAIGAWIFVRGILLVVNVWNLIHGGK